MAKVKSALLPLVDSQSVILILGTMPGEKSIALQQYYGNRGNHFWKILFTVFGEHFSFDYEVRKNLLAKRRIALWNILSVCEREGSQDKRIKNEKANDFDEFFMRHPNIRFVFFESMAASRLYSKYAGLNPDITYHTLPSTSGLNAHMTLDEKLAAWAILLGY